MHGELLHWHPHIHALVTCGAFTHESVFLELPEFEMDSLLLTWQEPASRAPPEIDGLVQELYSCFSNRTIEPPKPVQTQEPTYVDSAFYFEPFSFFNPSIFL